jgi:hypothetical protein
VLSFVNNSITHRFAPRPAPAFQRATAPYTPLRSPVLNPL